MSSSASRIKQSSFGMWLILVGAAALRFYDLDSESIWLDEAISVERVSLDFEGMLRATTYGQTPPLHNVLLFGVVRLLGDGEAAVRLLSAVFGVINIIIIYSIGRELFGKSSGLVAAALMAIAPFQVTYAQEARAYSLFALTASLSVLCLVRYIRCPTMQSAIFYGAATTALLYSHPYALFILVAENIFFLAVFLRHRLAGAGVSTRDWAVIQTGIAVAFAAWLPFLIFETLRIQSEGFWIPKPDAWLLVSILRDIAGTTLVLAAEVLILAVAILLARYGQARTSVDEKFDLTEGEKLLLLGLWFVVPIAIPFLGSFILEPFLRPRYTIGSSPAWYLLVAVAVGRLCERRSAISGLLVVAILAATLPALATYYRSTTKPDWRSAMAYVEDKAAADDILLTSPWFQMAPARYYAESADLLAAHPESPSNVMAGGRQRRVWILTTEAKNGCFADPPGSIEAERKLASRVQFVGVLVCLYE